MNDRPRSPLADYLLLLPGIGYIAVFIAATVAAMVLQSVGLFSVTGGSHFSLESWKIVTSKGVVDSVVFSLWLGVGSSAATVFLAFPLALFLRKPGPWKSSLGSILKIPLFVPALVATFLIVNLISYDGLVNDALLWLHLVHQPVRMLNDRWGIGVIVIQVWKNLPFVVLILSASIAGIRDDVIDAARNLGAGRLAVVWHIILPLAMPGVLVGTILMFIRAFGDYPITSLEGPVYPSSIAVRMYTTATLYQQWDSAAVVGVIITVTTLLVVGAYSRLAGLVTRE